MVTSMQSTNKTYLSFEEVCELLPEHLRISADSKMERSVYRTKENKPLPIVNSRLYPEHYYWYSCLTKYFKDLGAEYICFTAGNYGILIIPIDVVLHYNKFSGWKGEGKKGRQYHVRIKHNADNEFTFLNFNEPKENINITKYLIKYK